MRRWRVMVAAGAVGLVGMSTVACSSSTNSASGSSSTTAKPTSGTSGATTGTSPAKAGSTDVKRFKGASGADVQAKPPLETSTFVAKVEYADTVTPTSTFTASDKVEGTSLSELGSWTTQPAGDGSASGSTSTTAGAAAKPASFSQTTGTTPSSSSSPSGNASDLCNGSQQFGCIVYSTGWVRLAADAGTTSSITCPADHPYIQGPWVSSLDPENGVTSWAFDPQWDWARDHWTITVWSLGQTTNGWKFGAQNWNTVLGDAWHYAVYIACGTQQSQPPSQPPPAASPGTTAG